MSICRFPTLTTAAFLLLLPVCLAGAQDQSDLEIRQENQKLQTQVRDLQAELAVARQQLADLQSQVEQLRKELASANAAASAARHTAPTPPPVALEKPEVVTIDESVPNASPRALLAALSESYREALGGLSIGDDITRDGKKNRTIYLQKVDQWSAGATRHFRSQIEWHVMITTLPPLPPGNIIEMQAVDPQTRVRLGRPFRIELTRFQMDRLRRLEDLGQLDLLLLRGTVEPRIIINRDLEYASAFDTGRYIGPFAEFGFTIKIKSIMEPREAEAPDTGKAAPESKPAPQAATPTAPVTPDK